MSLSTGERSELHVVDACLLSDGAPRELAMRAGTPRDLPPSAARGRALADDQRALPVISPVENHHQPCRREASEQTGGRLRALPDERARTHLTSIGRPRSSAARAGGYRAPRVAARRPPITRSALMTRDPVVRRHGKPTAPRLRAATLFASAPSSAEMLKRLASRARKLRHPRGRHEVDEFAARR